MDGVSARAPYFLQQRIRTVAVAVDGAIRTGRSFDPISLRPTGWLRKPGRLEEDMLAARLVDEKQPIIGNVAERCTVGRSVLRVVSTDTQHPKAVFLTVYDHMDPPIVEEISVCSAINREGPATILPGRILTDRETSNLAAPSPRQRQVADRQIGDAERVPPGLHVHASGTLSVLLQILRPRIRWRLSKNRPRRNQRE